MAASLLLRVVRHRGLVSPLATAIAIPGSLPANGQNSPLLCPLGFYAEYLSGTSFTTPRYRKQAELPLVIQLQAAEKGGDEAVELRCTSWRTAGEANILAPCQGLCAARSCRPPATLHARPTWSLEASQTPRAATGDAATADAMQAAWVFDVDGTLLSNLPYYAQHGYGLELFDHREFDRWVETGEAPAIPSSLRQYREVRDLGFKTFLLTGRRVVCSFLIECPVQIIARYATNKSMDGCAFCNADSDFLIVPQHGRLKGNTRSPLELLGGQTCTTSNSSSKEGRGICLKKPYKCLMLQGYVSVEIILLNHC
ncbi:hypothetical protein ZWY2020_058471 [Hordeum vulgare]|nr:hypothetical protein ZWY2020_058471 [Hordeum vulgare]